MRFNVFGGQVGKNENVQINEAVAELRDTLRGNFDHCPAALLPRRAAQKSLQKKAARHGHLEGIGRFLLSDPEPERRSRRDFRAG